MNRTLLQLSGLAVLLVTASVARAQAQRSARPAVSTAEKRAIKKAMVKNWKVFKADNNASVPGVSYQASAFEVVGRGQIQFQGTVNGLNTLWFPRPGNERPSHTSRLPFYKGKFLATLQGDGSYQVRALPNEDWSPQPLPMASPAMPPATTLPLPNGQP